MQLKAEESVNQRNRKLGTETRKQNEIESIEKASIRVKEERSRLFPIQLFQGSYL